MSETSPAVHVAVERWLHGQFGHDSVMESFGLAAAEQAIEHANNAGSIWLSLIALVIGVSGLVISLFSWRDSKLRDNSDVAFGWYYRLQTWQVVNRGPSDAFGVAVGFFGEGKAADFYGEQIVRLEAGDRKTFTIKPFSEPMQVFIEWRDGRGTLHRRTLEIKPTEDAGNAMSLLHSEVNDARLSGRHVASAIKIKGDQQGIPWKPLA